MVKGWMVAFALVASAASAAPAEACKCTPPSLSASYSDATDVLQARVMVGATLGYTQWYLARVGRVFKGCLKPGKWVFVRTSSSSAACGVVLKTGATYLLTAADQGTFRGLPVLGIHSCAYNRPIQDLSKVDLAFLQGRTVCCKDKCVCANGSPMVNCFVDPCQVASCPSGTCTANYCGGCNAEFWGDSGQLLCLPCASNADCDYGLTCAEGQCVPGCQDDGDCAATHWCSPTQTEAMICKPYQVEGEWCGGFTPWWAQSKCLPGLICTDFPEWVADAPGVCRLPCKSSADCPESQFCTTGGVCRDDGECKVPADCTASGNGWIHSECAGYATCSTDGKCGWNCGTPDLCKDLTGTWFGPCDAILGVGVVDGQCAWISGCSTTVPLFETMEACQAACGGKLKWFTTCGDPVCSGWKPKAGVPKCTTETEGAACATDGAVCDPGSMCNALLKCTTSDPKLQPGGCPISRKSEKVGITYLDTAAKEKLHTELLGLKLATWRYTRAADPKERLGFIIEDAEPSVTVDSKRGRVDLYAYTSMAVAALQRQAATIERLEKELKTLRAEVHTLRATKK